MKLRQWQLGWIAGAIAFGQSAAWADEAFERRHAELLRHSELQFSFENAAPPPPPPPDWLRGLSQFLSTIAPVFGWLLWIGLAVLAAALVYFIGREIWAARWGKRVKADAPPAVQQPDLLAPERARALLSEADRLAAEGQYELAARTLLHRSIEDIEARRPNTVRRSYTAREIEASGLPDRLRSAFALIAQSVERSLFGGRALQQADWLSCRSAYEPFTVAEVWSS